MDADMAVSYETNPQNVEMNLIMFKCPPSAGLGPLAIIITQNPVCAATPLRIS
jgi:hypothetical protein